MYSFKMYPIKRKGFTLQEILVVLSLVGLLLVIAVPSFNGTVSRWEINQGVRTVTSSLSTARFHAVSMKCSIKFIVEEGRRIVLNKKINNRWTPYKAIELNSPVTISSNASPVFAPTGLASPLCTIRVETEYYKYKITLSMAGRIKVSRVND